MDERRLGPTRRVELEVGQIITISHHYDAVLLYSRQRNFGNCQSNQGKVIAINGDIATATCTNNCGYTESPSSWSIQ